MGYNGDKYEALRHTVEHRRHFADFVITRHADRATVTIPAERADCWAAMFDFQVTTGNADEFLASHFKNRS